MTREEAIEVYNGLINTKIKEAFEFFAPELRESEGERIRKFLVKHVSEWIGCIEHDLKFSSKDVESEEELAMFKAGLVYLEKQKEQKPLPKFKVGDTIHCKYDDREFTIKSVDLTNMVYKYTKEGCGNDIDYADEDFELVEQKPAERSETKINGEPISTENNSVDIPLVEWSEEDEDKLNHILEIVHIASGSEASVDEKEELESFLKSLRPQSKDEIYKGKDEAFKLGKHQLAIKFMNYLDENRPEGKMGLSNGECEDIDKAFKENDWAKILRYAEKYGK